MVWGSYDFVYLAELPYYAARLTEAHDIALPRERVLAAVGELLRRDLWQAGDLAAPGFSAWPCTPDTAIARIEREWNSHIGPLEPGDIAWFANTVTGNELARELLAAGFRSVTDDEG